MNTTIIQHYIQTPNNLLALLSRFRIVIPGIQRHYVQGANNPKAESIRNQFVNEILSTIEVGKSLNLHFIYGPIDTDGEDSFVPVDGQQRLTTLWLIARYATEHIEYSKRDEVLRLLSRFSYEDRINAKRFCHALTLPESNWDIEEDPNSDIISQTWFLDYWKEDETVASMIRMLSTIHHEWNNPERNLSGEQVLEALGSIISFELKIDSFGDDIYMKMNARGLQLTQWENFKSKYAESLGEYKEKFEAEIEDLSNIFFIKSSDEHELPDSTFFALFARIMNYECSQKCGYNIRQLASFTQTTWKQTELPFVPYSDIKEAIYTNKISVKTLSETYCVMIRTILENSEEIVPYFESKNLFETFFHPTNTNELDFSICCYVYFKEFGKVNNEAFLQATRLIWNILENVNRDDKNLYNRITIINRFIKLGSTALYSEDAMAQFGNDDAAQALEEAEKSKKIYDEDQSRPHDWDESVLGEWVGWRQAIEYAENIAFFKGTIRFLYRNNNGDATWENYATKLCNCLNLFSPDGLNANYKVKANKVLISHCENWNVLHRIPVFDSRKESWKRILTESRLVSSVCNLLMNPSILAEPHDSILKILIDNTVWTDLIKNTNGFELEWKADSPALWLNRYLGYTLKLLRNNREDILDAFIQNPNIKFELPEERRYISINGINHYYAIPYFFIYNYNGKDYRFAWQPWGYIDLYEENKKLYDLYFSKYKKGFNVRIHKELNEEQHFTTGADFYIEQIESCIKEYEKFLIDTKSG